MLEDYKKLMLEHRDDYIVSETDGLQFKTTRVLDASQDILRSF